jgi:hypothetical protein
MRKKVLIGITLVASSLSATLAQRNCGTMDNLARLITEHPELSSVMENIEEHTRLNSNNERIGTIYNIPVVVHVVYNTTTQNISDAQIQSQIAVLNKDFRRLNTDAAYTPSAFTSIAADAEISFCLATKDPNGNATTGITRTYTSTTSFIDNDAVKSSTTGGKNAWPAGSYLNLWVCNLGGGLLGYAQFPGGPAFTDGVVIGYQYFGTTGTVAAPYNKGRTATHEVGHWLNLRHIWGDASCATDYVSDTPTQSTSNYGCPSYPHPTCSNSSDMFMNYMDYTDDACMNVFSLGQKTRMRALFATGGARASLLTSTGCSGTTTTTPTTPSSVAVTVGTGTGSTGNAPYGTYYMDERCQFIITKAELQAAGWTSSNNSISALAFNVYTASSQTMYGFTIKIRHTTATSFTSTSYLSTTGMSTVYTGNVSVTGAGWKTHTFSAPFAYNGVDNLLIDICWNNSSYTTDSKVYASSTSDYKTLYYKNDVASGGVCANTTGTQSTSRPNMKLTFSSSTPAKLEYAGEETAANEEAINFQLYPNPASEQFTISYEIRKEAAQVEVAIYDMMGKMVARMDQGMQNEGEHALNVSVQNAGTNGLPAGIYMCTLNIDGKLHTKRFVIND